MSSCGVTSKDPNGLLKLHVSPFPHAESSLLPLISSWVSEFLCTIKVMASSAALSKKQFKRSMTKKSHSWWWDSHNCPKNSKWLAENLEKMDDRVNHMLKLIEEDADSFAKKAQMYYQKRPELIHLVEEFYRMYRALAERYDQASGELQKNVSSGIQSQASLEQSSPKEEDSSSLTEDSGSDSDSKSVPDDEDGDEALIRRMADLELELQETKQKLLLQQENVNNNTDFLHKITVYEGELREANEKIRMHEEEISNLKIELQSCMSSRTEDAAGATKVQDLEEELSIAKEKLQHFEKEISCLRSELEISKAEEEKLQSLQHELKLAQNDADAEKKEVLRLQERMIMVESSLQHKDNEIRELKAAVSDAEEKVITEKEDMKGEMSKLLEERRQLEEKLRLVTEEKAEMEEKLRGESQKISVMSDESDVLREESGKKEEKIKEMEKHMKELHMEQVRLRRRSSELSEEVEKTRVAASEVAEQKREAIRQLCASLDYYKDGYERLWKAVAGHKRRVVLAN
ncbi:unnamed protein product [Brassica oleracea var. botrytis]|uniref:NAB domain-containing protein n=2 Tax=Brassica TaxID=3705 RepID=A0A3P6C652_BRAOL|nr:unnamed protein product [Brassica napus]VDD14027.1 unnamed protein product [Brassica oleracea]